MNDAAGNPSPPASSEAWTRILAKLEAARPHLLRGGAVVLRRNPKRAPAWVLRYRVRENGRRRLKSIYLGSTSIAQQARGLIKQWREEAVAPLDRVRARVLQLADKGAQVAGLSGKARRRLSRAVKPAVDDPISLLAMSAGAFPINDPLIRDGKRHGRPSKSGLW